MVNVWSSILSLIFFAELCCGSLNVGLSKLYTVARDYHDKEVAKLSSTIKANPNKVVTIKRKPAESHCARPHNYKKHSVKLDMSGFTKILSVEEAIMDEIPPHLRKLAAANGDLASVVDVQAMCSFETLVDALLPMGLIPAVVPEFKGITIGGSLQGLAAESTSFKYGFVHDTITGFEALLGDGTVVWCSPSSNAELFYSLPGSFGSLAICTRIRMLCIKAKPYVRCTCRHFNSQRECLAFMSGVQDRAKIMPPLSTQSADLASEAPEPVADMIEALGFSKNQFVSVEGCFQSDVGELISSRCNAYGYKWFYNQVRDLFRPTWWRTSPAMKSAGSRSLILPTKDYLFRHDRGSFWMASYRIPQIVGQYLMGALLDNAAMFQLANALPWAFPKSQIVLQDFMLPRTTCEAFFNQSNDVVQVWPIWLLPMRNFAAENRNVEKHAVFGVQFGEPNDLCNIGIYGIPKNRYNFEQANRLLEAVLFQHGGRKVYYSHSFYERNFFYHTLYDGRRYMELRKKYHAAQLPEIYDKVIVKDGKL